jgi:hypothetical protein
LADSHTGSGARPSSCAVGHRRRPSRVRPTASAQLLASCRPRWYLLGSGGGGGGGANGAGDGHGGRALVHGGVQWVYAPRPRRPVGSLAGRYAALHGPGARGVFGFFSPYCWRPPAMRSAAWQGR